MSISDATMGHAQKLHKIKPLRLLLLKENTKWKKRLFDQMERYPGNYHVRFTHGVEFVMMSPSQYSLMKENEKLLEILNPELEQQIAKLKRELQHKQNQEIEDEYAAQEAAAAENG